MAVDGCGSEDLKGAPDVNGLTLDVAKQTLSDAGYTPDVHDDSMFGVIVESHFTVCTEHTPKGTVVPLDVSKSC